MEKIDFVSLIKQPENEQDTAKNDQNQAKSRAMPYQFPTDITKSGEYNIMNTNDKTSYALVALPALLKNEGGRIINNESPAPEGGSTEKLRAGNLHPIAVCLLLYVARKIQSADEEILHELTRLEAMTPIEQVKTWATYAVENDIDPHQIIYPFIQSSGKGNDCMTCQHLDMICTKQPRTKRKLYQWQCKKQHAILEAYYLRERILIAPVECADHTNQLST